MKDHVRITERVAQLVRRWLGLDLLDYETDL